MELNNYEVDNKNLNRKNREGKEKSKNDQYILGVKKIEAKQNINKEFTLKQTYQVANEKNRKMKKVNKVVDERKFNDKCIKLFIKKD